MTVRLNHETREAVMQARNTLSAKGLVIGFPSTFPLMYSQSWITAAIP